MYVRLRLYRNHKRIDGPKDPPTQRLTYRQIEKELLTAVRSGCDVTVQIRPSGARAWASFHFTQRQFQHAGEQWLIPQLYNFIAPLK
jgi:hypothetical protein